MSFFDPVWGSRWMSIWEGSFVGGGDTPIIPLFDGAYWCAPLKNNGADTVTDGSLTVTRLSPKNFETTSGFKTVGDNEGAYTGEGVLLEGEGTNLIRSSNIQPIDLSGCFTQLGGTDELVDVGSSAIDAGFTPKHNGLVYQLTTDPSQSSSQILFSGTPTSDNGDVVSLQCWARVVKQGDQDIYLRFSNYSLVTARTLISGADWKYYDLSFAIPVGQGNRRLSVAALGTGSTESIVQIIGMQREEGYPSSLIESDNVSPVTRNADTATAPTSNAFVDAMVNTGERTEFGWVDGVALTTISFFDSDPDKTGKYNQLVTLEWDGVLYESYDKSVLIELGYTGSNATVAWTMKRNLTGLADVDAVRSKLGGAATLENPAKMDFSRSAYDLAGAKALRQSVDDYGKNIGNTVSFSSLAAGASVGGNTLTINGSYTSSDPLIGANIDGVDIRATDTLYYKVSATVNAGSVALLGTTINATGDYIIAQTSGMDIPVPIVDAPVIVADATGAVDMVLNVEEVSILRWYDFPLNNFTHELTIKPTGQFTGLPVFYLEDTSSSFGIYAFGSDVDELTFIAFNNPDIDSIVVPTPFNIGTEYAAKVSLTDTQFIVDIDGTEYTAPRTVSPFVGNWANVEYLSGAPTASNNGEYSDHCVKDYQP